MRRCLISVLLCLLVAGTAWTQTPQAPNNLRLVEIQFEESLDRLQRQRIFAQTNVLTGLVGVVAGGFTASVFTTLQSGGVVSAEVGQTGTVASLTGSAAFGALAVFSFVRWQNKTDEYLLVRRQQARYWNLVGPY